MYEDLGAADDPLVELMIGLPRVTEFAARCRMHGGSALDAECLGLTVCAVRLHRQAFEAVVCRTAEVRRIASCTDLNGALEPLRGRGIGRDR